MGMNRYGTVCTRKSELAKDFIILVYEYNVDR